MGRLSPAMRRVLLYLWPHLVASIFGLVMAKGVALVAGLGGSCSFLCNPVINAAMGLTGGLLGAQLYRSEHPLPDADHGEP